jgi:hypothetical protein
MIELPQGYTIASATPALIDFGVVQEANGATTYVARPGSRYSLQCSLGPFYPDQARVIVARLLSAKRKGLRIALPLQVNQGNPGTTLVNGDITAAGETLLIKGGTPGYLIKEGYWLSIENADGDHNIYNVETGGFVNGSGQVSITVSPPISKPYEDGDRVHLGKPMMQGLVIGNQFEWSLSVDRMTPINFGLIEQ